MLWCRISPPRRTERCPCPCAARCQRSAHQVHRTATRPPQSPPFAQSLNACSTPSNASQSGVLQEGCALLHATRRCITQRTCRLTQRYCMHLGGTGPPHGFAIYYASVHLSLLYYNRPVALCNEIAAASSARMRSGGALRVLNGFSPFAIVATEYPHHSPHSACAAPCAPSAASQCAKYHTTHNVSQCSTACVQSCQLRVTYTPQRALPVPRTIGPQMQRKPGVFATCERDGRARTAWMLEIVPPLKVTAPSFM